MYKLFVCECVNREDEGKGVPFVLVWLPALRRDRLEKPMGFRYFPDLTRT